MVLLCYKILNKAGRCRSSDVRRHFYGKEDFSPRVAPASDEVQTAQPGGKKTVIVPNLSEQDATTLVDVLKDMGFAYRLEDAA